jgi:ribosomal protein S18 acetylase RimI-like enzyme
MLDDMSPLKTPEPPVSFAHPTIHPVARLLPPEEWSRVPAFAALNPSYSFVVVVENGTHGEILAEWAAMTVAHVEGLSVHEPYRGHAGVARALLQCMVGELKAAGVTEVLTQSLDEGVSQMIQQAGGKEVPGTTWVIPLPKDGA